MGIFQQSPLAHQEIHVIMVIVKAIIRQPAVAGLFYPGDADELRRDVHAYVNQASVTTTVTPKALIVPHAGYMYSGPVAGKAYRNLTALGDKVERVVLLGPAHRVGFQGLALSETEFFLTPLGDVPIDHSFDQTLLQLPFVKTWETPHVSEHSLEVQLPFLQEILGHFKLIPIVVGEARPEDVGQVLSTLWDGPKTLFIISSDLSHYHDYDTAQKRDKKTAQAIENLKPEDLHHDDACGRNPIRGLLNIAKQRGLNVTTLDLRNSGDTAGAKDQVVGYGAWSFTESR